MERERKEQLYARVPVVTCMAVYASLCGQYKHLFFSPDHPNIADERPSPLAALQREKPCEQAIQGPRCHSHTHASRKLRNRQPSKPSMRPSHAHHFCLFRREATGYTLSNLGKGSLKQCRGAVDMDSMAGRQKAQTTKCVTRPGTPGERKTEATSVVVFFSPFSGSE